MSASVSSALESSAGERFREGVRAHFGERRVRSKYPAELRALAVEFWEAERRRGMEMGAVAKELGIELSTLRTWATQSRPAMRPVIVREDNVNDEARSIAFGNRQPVVRCGHGVSIEGLSIGDVVTLIRGLAS